MYQPAASIQELHKPKKPVLPDWLLLAISILLQVVLALFFGHAYDMRILMSAGYLVGTGQNPYMAQDLSAVFHNGTFQGITTFGYPPPWALVLGLVYLVTFRIIPNFLLFNLFIKLPVIAANIGVAYLVVHILGKFQVDEKTSRRAWLFLLFNPFLLLTSSAWGQFDPVVALLALWSIFLFSEGKLTAPTILLALAISLKPIALPLIPVIFIYLAGKSVRGGFHYLAILILSMILFCVAPFALMGWDPSPILQHWNHHFTVGGGMSFMTFLEYVKWSYQLYGLWWIVGWLWVPALGFAVYALRQGIQGLRELIQKSAALILVFFLCRAWMSETNINLLLPMVLILVSISELDRPALAFVWVVPLIFSFFNTSIAQLLFPSLPGMMDTLLKFAVDHMNARYVLRTLTVAVWLAGGSWIALRCFKRTPASL